MESYDDSYEYGELSSLNLMSSPSPNHSSHKNGHSKKKKKRHSNPDKNKDHLHSNTHKLGSKQNTKSLKQQLKQLDIEKYLNMNKNRSPSPNSIHHNINNLNNNHSQRPKLMKNEESDISLKTTIIHHDISNTIQTSQSITTSSSSGSSETDEMAPLRENALLTTHNLNLLPTRSNVLSTSSMAVSVATSVIEDSYRDGM